MNQIEMFNKLVDKQKDEIFKLREETNYDNLTFNYDGKNKSVKTFNDLTDVINLWEKMKKGDIDLEKTRKNQEEFKSELAKIKKISKNQIRKKVN